MATKNSALVVAACCIAVAGMQHGLAVFAQQQPPSVDRWREAIRVNNLVDVRRLAAELDVNAEDGSGMTPLALAAAFGTREAVDVLLGAGADVRGRNRAGLTALHVAWRDAALVRLLLEKGADVHARTELGATPLQIAGTEAVVAILLEEGADPDAAENRGVTPLVAAAGVGNTAVAKLLLAHGANPNAFAKGEGQKTVTPLMGAAHNGDEELTRLLLARHVDVNAVSPPSDGTVKHGPVIFGSLTALHLAVVDGNLAVVKLLLNAGASVDARDARGLTPLAWAVGTDRPDARIVRMLLDRGASPSAATKEGEAAAEWARKFNAPDVTAALKLSRNPVAPVVVPFTNAAASEPRQAVERSLSLLRTASAQVMTEGGCVACHAQPVSAIASEYASRRGWRVEGPATPATPATDVAQVTSAISASPRGAMQGREAGGLPDTYGYNVLMAATLNLPPTMGTDAIVQYFIAKQRPAGNWHGIGTRAPIQDGDFSRTAIGIRILSVYGAPAQKADIADRVARAAKWLADQSPVSTEERAMQLLGLSWAGAGQSVRQSRLRELINLQRRDGGWGQTPNLVSDAYATGQLLFALRELGVPATDAAVRRGVAFLVGTQAKDGSWFVKSRAMKIQPYFESGFPYGEDQWISQSGTAWAAIGLSVAAPEPSAATAGR
jgi:ankyrin repeat protein